MKKNKNYHLKFIQKFKNIAHISFTQHALDQNYINFLFKMNNKTTNCQKTKSNILGKAKIMKFKDLEAAQVKQAKKYIIKESKSKARHSKKCKIITPEFGVSKLGPTSEMPRMNKTKIIIKPKPLRAPMAQMQ